HTAAVRPGDSVVVIGAGGVGLNALQGAVIAGAGEIIALDVVAAKLAAARRFGAAHALDARADDLVAAVYDLTGGRGADHVLVTVGSGAAVAQGLSLLARGGNLVLVGMPPSGVAVALDPGALAGNHPRVLGTRMGGARIRADIPWLIALYRQGRLKLDELVSGCYPLARINEAIASSRNGEALRNVIMF
ncbi:MAG: zinc-binding dehydrogenase, partial [Candidatus Competibacterales bacterium]|nr:zinc-binding dehydrogenase [Candidatus Competibacterales bacterium]